MDFRIADTFTDSLARLTADEQKAVKTTAFDLQVNPASPGLQFHKLEKGKDKNFWSVRVSADVRVIVHRTPGSLLLCYVDHHDKAYAWAERRKLEMHPKTGAAQLVEIRETVREIVIHQPVEASRQAAAPKTPFVAIPDTDLLGYGVPTEWLADVRTATEDSILTIAAHLPAEAAEALLEIAVGETPRKPQVAAPTTSPFDHPDAQRRFRVVSDVDELARALEYPWEKWTVFLHPAQRELVERRFGGPARVSGSAGTGKTIVALNRAAFLARTNADARVLLTTFSDSLASALRMKLHHLIGMEPRVAERIEVHAVEAVARRLYERTIGPANIASPDVIRSIVAEAAAASPDHKFSLGFLVSEWTEIVDAWQLASWDAYRDVARLGRKTRLPEKARQQLWTIFECVRAALEARGLATQADMYNRLASHLATKRKPPYDFVVVDEAQDVSVPQLRFLSALGGARADALFFAGDLGQRIFQLPFSWKSLGVDIRGRSGTLRINYRTSHQIRAQADRLLGKQIADVDGNVDDRSGTISAFNGPAPVVKVASAIEEECSIVRRWIMERTADGVKPDELAVVVRSPAQVERARRAVAASGVPFILIDERMDTRRGHVSIGTMHLSKGLEFRAVAVMACDDEVIPLQDRVEAVTDDADLQEVYDTERHLLYVACTRARDHLLVTGVSPASEFLEDFAT
jgi:mRNA-degrading endonuclease RelE of RelBE toxin-antitoxin system